MRSQLVIPVLGALALFAAVPDSAQAKSRSSFDISIGLGYSSGGYGGGYYGGGGASYRYSSGGYGHRHGYGHRSYYRPRYHYAPARHYAPSYYYRDYGYGYSRPVYVAPPRYYYGGSHCW